MFMMQMPPPLSHGSIIMDWLFLVIIFVSVVSKDSINHYTLRNQKRLNSNQPRSFMFQRNSVIV